MSLFSTLWPRALRICQAAPTHFRLQYKKMPQGKTLRHKESYPATSLSFYFISSTVFSFYTKK